MQAAIRNKQEERRKNFKKGLDASDFRRRREEETSQIRKNKRDEMVMKRRNMGNVDTAPAMKTSEDIFLDSTESDGQLSSFIQQIYSSEPEQVLIGTRSVRKILSRESYPPIEEVIKSGVIPRLVELLKIHTHEEIQFEAAWALTNIASGTAEQTQVVIGAGAVPAFVEMTTMAQKDENKEQATWALGNIAGDSPQCRDYVLSCNALTPLLHNLQTSSSKTFLRNAAWSLSNLVRGKPAPNFHLIAPALKPLYRLLHLNDEEILTDACWALSYMTEGEDYRIQGVVEAGLIPRLAQLLRHSSITVVTPALRAIGNIVTGTKAQTQAVLDVGALQDLYQLLTTSDSRNLTKECCWAISNIAAGTHQQIQEIIDQGFLPVLLPIFSNSEFEIKKELAWAITNAISGGTNQQIIHFVDQGFLKPLCDLLATHDSTLAYNCLEAIEKVLSVGETLTGPKTNNINPFTLTLEKIGAVDTLEDLQNHSLKRVHELAERILEEYFEDDDENVFEDGNSASVNTNTTNEVVPHQQPFSFGGDRFNMSGNFVF